MKKLMVEMMAISICGSICFIGCSKESRDDTIDRLAKAGKALNGEVRPDDKEHETPNVVHNQQRKERIRQNTKWTVENQVKYPKEYCLAMLEQVDKDAEQCSIFMHKCRSVKASVLSKLSRDETNLKNHKDFLKLAKEVYRNADTSGKWPARVKGYEFSKDKLQEKIVESAQKIVTLEFCIGSGNANLVKLERKIDRMIDEQKKIVATKESLQRTLENLQMKEILESEDGIKSSIDAINAAIAALDGSDETLSLDEIVQPDKNAERKSTFEAIMAE